MKHRKISNLLQDKKVQEKYDPQVIEPYWQSKWEEEAVYQANLETAETPFYNLMMFPYPSAEGLHVGSVFTFSGVDIYGRFKRMQGNEVFEPIGLDGFGIHSENHAIKTGTHPMDHAKRTEETFYRQLHSIGNGFDWEHKLETYDPNYYKWTQWLFIELFKAGLAYRKKSPVNFCPSCKTVLADEQVVEGKCERCGSVVEKRDLEQWFFRITRYAERLLQNLETMDWTEKVKIAQKNWIGKSEGALITFSLKNIPGQQDNKHKVQVFTTRPDTLYGATFLVISPETGKKWLEVGWKASKEIVSYIEMSLKKDQIARTDEKKDKTGVFTGIMAINPVNNEEIPVWVADYVLGGYGTGAIMAVPAHDQRDFDFARRYGLVIREVIASEEGVKEKAYVGAGELIQSGEWDGWEVPESLGKVISWLEKKGIGKKQTTYRLRDWLISRQRYWGPPIPMIYCKKCASEGKSWFTGSENSENSVRQLTDQKVRKSDNQNSEMAGWYPVQEKELPVKLPYIKDFKPTGTGKAPLASSPEFYETVCPACGSEARRETDVSDTFLDSAWYFLRYLDPKNKNEPFDGLRVKRWLPVHMYIGGAEHSVLHLLYARFVTMALHDLGYVHFEEPFKRFYAHGLMIKDGAKMSKSKGNVINPDEYIKKFGADTLRTYLHFLGPFNESGDFRDSGVEGMNRFLKRVWTLFKNTRNLEPRTKNNEERMKMMHKTIAGVTEDLEGLRYNTAIAKLMIWYNSLVKEDSVGRIEIEVYLKLLAPFAPHMAEELWQKNPKGKGKFESIHLESWPGYDPRFLQEDMVTIAVQVNGKLRDTIKTENSKLKTQNDIEKMARERVSVMKYLEGKKILKVIYVPHKIINFVVGE